MATIYSTQLAAQVNYVGLLDVLVPSGFILVVRDIDATFGNNAYTASINFLGNINNELFGHVFPSGGFSWVQWQGRQVFETGQMFQISVGSGGANGVGFQVSGYKLALP